MAEHRKLDRTGNTPPLTCSEFDALLIDALDGTLTVPAQHRFDAHREQCVTCGSLFRETSAGMNWLTGLDEVEPPVNLVHNIMAATTMRPSAVAAAPAKLGWKIRLAGIANGLIAPARALIRQPRLAMTTAMAIFSLSLTLNLAGVKLTDLKDINLRPSAIREQATLRYTAAENRVIHYYNSFRLVYEVESRLQDLKRATATDETPNTRTTPRNKTDNEKNDQNRKQNYYSMRPQNTVLAGWRNEEFGNNRNMETWSPIV
ncbi:MAG TPA: hypothetical protein VFQ00_03330 [Terriglobales bacterium]|nr:hypothetical protein [Terriglobales bacterium]